jgi:hypothetical protein
MTVTAITVFRQRTIAKNNRILKSHIFSDITPCSPSVITEHRTLHSCNLFNPQIQQLNSIYKSKIYYLTASVSSGLSSWLQIRSPGFYSRHYQEKK